MENWEAILRENLKGLIQQVDDRLATQQRILEKLLLQRPPFSSSPSSVAPKRLLHDDLPDELHSPKMAHPGVDLMDPWKVEETPDVSEPTAQLDSQVSGDTKLAESQATEPIKRRQLSQQNSYEMAQQEEMRMAPESEHIDKSMSINHFGAPKPKDIKDPARRYIAELVWTWQFETFFALIIFAHAMLLGVQIEWECSNVNESLPQELAVIHACFTFLFLVEVILRIIASGCREFFCGGAGAWNMLDVFLVVVALVELIADALVEDSLSAGGWRLLRILRLARSARGLRIVRLLRFVRPLRLLVFSIAITLKSLVWSIILLLLIIYLFSLLFADANLTYLHSPEAVWDEDQDKNLKFHFGTVLVSMHTLFRAISGGLEWRHAVMALENSLGWGWSSLFTLYIAFCCFAVLNVMTGVFCHSAITGAEQDHELMVQSMVNEQERIKAAFADLFRRMDKDGSGTITIREFENQFHVQNTKALFEALGLKAEDAWTLFRSLDKDGDHCIGEAEFVEGCIHVRGPAREVDLLRQSQRTRIQLETLEQNSQELSLLLQGVAQVLKVELDMGVSGE
ncbi:unnamed protein product [Effrenium voratum]|nr:unnamed protein product [Effrenium voratum]